MSSTSIHEEEDRKKRSEGKRGRGERGGMDGWRETEGERRGGMERENKL